MMPPCAMYHDIGCMLQIKGDVASDAWAVEIN